MTLTVSCATPFPFAEFFNTSAAPTGDCDLRSGETFGQLDMLQVDDFSTNDHPWFPCFRFGEALHPGPSPLGELVVGCTNPGGLRFKEALAISQGPGVWTYAETQLSAVTQISAKKALQSSLGPPLCGLVHLGRQAGQGLPDGNQLKSLRRLDGTGVGHPPANGRLNVTCSGFHLPLALYALALELMSFSWIMHQFQIELWSASVRAPGFDPSFSLWWEQQDFFLASGPLPQSPPDRDKATLIFEAFRHRFRDFERWHLNQKGVLIQNKYHTSINAIFHELRDPAPDQIDNLWTTHTYKVLAVRPDSKAVILDAKIVPMDKPLWTLNGCGLSVDGHLEEMLVFSSWPDVQVGHTLTQSTHTRSDDDVHQKLIELWQPRWQQLQAVDPSDWERISGFVQHFMPSFSFCLPDITPAQWMKTVRRFKPKAARGADGYAKLDLLHMSPVHVTWLLQLLNGIELGTFDWPRQLQEGLVLALAKCQDAHAAGSYRPIVLLSIIYRCWGSLRSRQLLRMLEPYIRGDALGFLPAQEAAQSWLQVQSCVELALQSGQALSGLAVDLIKAFNNIRRPQRFLLARHLGLPERLLEPWERFPSSFTRRFQVNNHLSSSLTSDVGFAEGDPLSVSTMAVLDWASHVYQQNFAPIARSLSFVDNIAIVSKIINN
eukprot:s2378_g8.t1